MPYIKLERRKVLGIDALSKTLGEGAYIAYREAVGLLNISDLSFSSRIAIYGMLVGTAAEFYRRHVGPYEDAKREMEGDVYGG